MRVDTHSARISLETEQMAAATPPPPKRRVPFSGKAFVRGLPATVVVHVIGGLVALMLSNTWANALDAAAGAGPDPLAAMSTGGAPTFFETMRGFSETTLPWAIASALTTLVLWWFASLALQMLWLRSMRDDAPRGAKAFFGSVLRGGFVTLAMIGPLMVAWALLIGLPALWHLGFRGDPDPRWHDYGMIVSLLPGVLTYAGWATVHDLARAAVARGDGIVRAIHLGWRERDAMLRYAFWALLGLGLTAVAVLQGSAALGWLIAQSLLLLRTLCRAAWLAHATVRLPE